jgi:hypothetical protein
MKPIYVACQKEDGKVFWLMNPKPFYNGKFCLWFCSESPVASVTTDIFRSGMDQKDFKEVLQDEMDRMRLPWTNFRNPRFSMKALNGQAVELFMMNFELVGPLPAELAAGIGGSRVRKPGIKVMSRFGG